MGHFADAAMIVLVGGLVAWMVQAAPAVDGTFKRWATYLVMAGTVWGVLARLGVLGHVGGLLR